MIVSFGIPKELYCSDNEPFLLEWSGLIGYHFTMFTVYYKYQNSSIWYSKEYVSETPSFDLRDILTFNIGEEKVKYFETVEYKIDAEFYYADPYSGDTLSGHETSEEALVIFKPGLMKAVMKVTTEDEYYAFVSDGNYDFGDEESAEEPAERNWDFDEFIQDERYPASEPHDLDLNLRNEDKEKGEEFPIFSFEGKEDLQQNSLRVKVNNEPTGVPLVSVNSPLASDIKINKDGIIKALAKDEPEFHYSSPNTYYEEPTRNRGLLKSGAKNGSIEDDFYYTPSGTYGSGYLVKYYNTYYDNYETIYYIRYSRETLYSYQNVYETYQKYNISPSYSYYANYGTQHTYTGPHYEDMTSNITVNGIKYYTYNANFINYTNTQSSTPVNQFINPNFRGYYPRYNYVPIRYQSDGYFYVNASYIENFVVEPKNIYYYYSNDTGYYYYYGYKDILYSTIVPTAYRRADRYDYEYSAYMTYLYSEYYFYYKTFYTYTYGGSYRYGISYKPFTGYYKYTGYNSYNTNVYDYYSYNASYYYYKNNLYYYQLFAYDKATYKYYTYYETKYNSYKYYAYKADTYYYTRYNGYGYYSYYYSYTYPAYSTLYSGKYYIAYYYKNKLELGPNAYYYYNYTSSKKYYYYSTTTPTYYYKYSYGVRHDYTYDTKITNYRYKYGSSYTYWTGGYYNALGYDQYTYSVARSGYNRSTRRVYPYYTFYTYYITFYYWMKKYDTRADKYSYVSGYSYRTETYTYYTYKYRYDSYQNTYNAMDHYLYNYKIQSYNYYYYYAYAYEAARSYMYYITGYNTYYIGSGTTAYYPYYYYNNGSTPVGNYYAYYGYYYTTYYAARNASMIDRYYKYVTGYTSNYRIDVMYQARYNYDKTYYKYRYTTPVYYYAYSEYQYYTSSAYLYIYDTYSYSLISYNRKYEGYNYKYKYYFGTYNYFNYTYYYASAYGPRYDYNRERYNGVQKYNYNYRYFEVPGYYTIYSESKIDSAYIVPKYNNAYYSVIDNLVYGSQELTYSDTLYTYVLTTAYYDYRNTTGFKYYNYHANYTDTHIYYNYGPDNYYITGYDSRLDYYYSTLIGYEDIIKYYYSYISGYFDHNEGLDHYYQYTYTSAEGHMEEYYYSGRNIYEFSYTYKGYYYRSYQYYYSTYKAYGIDYYYKYTIAYVNKAYAYVLDNYYSIAVTKEAKYIPIAQHKLGYQTLSVYRGAYFYLFPKAVYLYGTYDNNGHIDYYNTSFIYYSPMELYYTKYVAENKDIYTGVPIIYNAIKYVNDGT